MKQIRAERGFAAIAAIFLIVLLAALGGFMLTFSNTQQLTSAQDVQGTRAYWAARAGLEWGIGSVATGAVAPACPAASTILATTFDGNFQVTVTCNRTDYAEAGVNRFIYQLTSVAVTNGAAVGTIGYIERSLSASLER